MSLLNLSHPEFCKYLIFVLLFCICLYLTNKLYPHIRMMIFLSKFPGPKRSFIIGDTVQLMQPPDVLFKSLRKWSLEFYPHYTLRLFHCITLQILDPVDVEKFLGSRKIGSKRDVYYVLKGWLRESLLLSDGNKWERRRRILTPAFHFSILKSYINVFHEQTRKIIENISQRCHEPIDVHDISLDFSLHCINETSMGQKLDVKNERHKEYMDAINKISEVILDRTMSPIPNNSFFWMFSKSGRSERKLVKILHDFSSKTVAERMKIFTGSENNNPEDDPRKRKLDMLDILLQAHMGGEDIDYEGICEETDVFLFGGHDTSGTALGFCLMLLANNPEYQELIYEETKMILNGENRSLNFDDLQKMRILERVIKESLRLYPSIHFIERRVEEDVKLSTGLICPKDTFVNIHIFDIHRDPKIYPDPEKFDPDRFTPENCQKRHPYAFIPFSAGPRNCIGQKFAMIEMKTFLSGIIQNYTLHPVDTPETVVLKIEISLKTNDPVRVKFIPRK